MNIFNLIFKHKTMSEDSESQTEETSDEVKKDDKADEVFRDKPENETKEDTDKEELPEDVEEKTTATAETTEDESEKSENTDPDPEPVEDEEVEKDAEPLYQKKVYIIDLNNIGLKIEGEGELVVDVMSIDNDTNKAVVKNGDLTMEVPKEFLF